MKYTELLSLKLPWKKLQHANILLTGGNGLIVSSFADALMELNSKLSLDLNIYVLCRNAEKAAQRFGAYKAIDHFHLIIQDVSSPLDLDIHFQYIFHGASSADPEAFNSVPVDVMKSNFLGTLNLLQYAAQYSNSRLIFISSSEVYGENLNGVEKFSEEMPGQVDYTKFRSCYPESKRASETLCMSFKKQYNSDVVIVRPAFIYGKDILDSNTRADVYFLRQVLRHEDIPMYSEGTQVRSYCYISDCISGMLYAALLGDSGEVYNIGNEKSIVTLKEYAQALADIGGVTLRYEPRSAPSNVIFLKTQRCVLDTQKLEQLGWQPKYGLKEGIQHMLFGFKE
ncbi:NAD-dependent epimerase/dehydratase family protein [Aminipila butyrica]|uniref:NAD-dependent epimerase/dehydratase family protein n=1 Tax=Aminipila butyrica TaxID=433296 RepID=A0A858BSR0_9FIRM|nr:NAD-dependent epimerase/dehydratase family protein [Aminipila butyrica]QIB68145.1 NAD-dependent epimerase/dehydratase family protein [Aminipila butyrica]